MEGKNYLRNFYTILRISCYFWILFYVTLKKGNEQQIKSWIRDQYEHPVESLHTLDEVLRWFNKNNIEYINSIPSCNFGDRNDLELFQKTENGTFLSRLFSQISMLFNNLGSDGGLFVVIGKKKNDKK